MARQYLMDAGPVEPATSDPLAANTATTAVNMWHGLRYTPIFAYDARPGKIYVVEAGGLITTAATGALTISPNIATSGTTGGTTLGASIAQTVPASSLSGPWFLKMVLIVRSIGDPGGANSSLQGTGFFQSGGVAATANSGLNVAFGGTAAAFDHSVVNCIRLDKTLSVAGSFTTQWAWIHSPN